MRAPLVALMLAMSAPAFAQTAPQPAPQAAAADPLAAANDRVAQLQQQLGAAYAEIQRLKPLEAAAAQDKAALEVCTGKNVRLVRIGRKILAAYDRRYHRGHRDPLQLGRHDFEVEAQDYAGRIYDNRYDVPLSQQSPDSGQSVSTRDSGSLKNETKTQ